MIKRSGKPVLDLSIVIPVFNEQECIERIYVKLIEVCDRLCVAYEIIFVDDGSNDNTYTILCSLHYNNPKIRVLRFRKNYGQTAAMAAGFEHARGKIIVSMDGDLQNDPADIPRFLSKLDEGYDVVCGWRKNRQDKFWSRRLPSIVANWLIGKITGVKIHDNGCSLKGYRASVIKKVRLYSELHRFIPAMSMLTGARVVEIVVNHHPRSFGQSKYGMGRIWRVFLDIITVKMVTGFISRPAVWFGILSLPCILFGFLVLFIAIQSELFRLSEEWVVISTTALLSLFLGAHLISIGIIGELVVKTGDFSLKQSIKETITLQ